MELPKNPEGGSSMVIVTGWADSLRNHPSPSGAYPMHPAIKNGASSPAANQRRTTGPPRATTVVPPAVRSEYAPKACARRLAGGCSADEGSEGRQPGGKRALAPGDRPPRGLGLRCSAQRQVDG